LPKLQHGLKPLLINCIRQLLPHCCSNLKILLKLLLVCRPSPLTACGCCLQGLLYLVRIQTAKLLLAHCCCCQRCLQLLLLMLLKAAKLLPTQGCCLQPVLQLLQVQAAELLLAQGCCCQSRLHLLRPDPRPKLLPAHCRQPQGVRYLPGGQVAPCCCCCCSIALLHCRQ